MLDDMHLSPSAEHLQDTPLIDPLTETAVEGLDKQIEEAKLALLESDTEVSPVELIKPQMNINPRAI